MQLPADLCRQVLDFICDALVAVDEAGNITGCNAGFLRLTGGDTRPAAVERIFPKGFRPLDFADTAGPSLRRCTVGTPAGPVPALVAYTADGGCILASIRLMPGPSPDDLPAWVNKVLEGSDSVIILLDGAGLVKRFNRAAERITGYSAADVAGRPFWEAPLFAGEGALVRAEFERLLSGEHAVSRFESDCLMKDGSVRIFTWSNSVTHGADGEVEYVVATALDVTAERQNESALASLSGAFIDAQSAGRRNVSGYLHDTVSQYLVVLALTLSKLQRAPDLADPFEVAPTLELVNRCCRDLRVISYALAPPVFEDAEPAVAFAWYINHLREDAGVDVEFEAGLQGGHIPAEVRKLLLAVVQEWAEKTIRVRMVGRTKIILSNVDSGVRLELLSDQPGNPAVLAVSDSRIIRERVRALGGTLELQPRESGVSVVIVIAAN